MTKASANNGTSRRLNHPPTDIPHQVKGTLSQNVALPVFLHFSADEFADDRGEPLVRRDERLALPTADVIKADAGREAGS